MAQETLTQGAATSSSPLREGLDNATRIFWCNTNRGAGQNGLERRMHAKHFAAACLPVDCEHHMRRVRAGDVIFMYANGIGIIGNGRATESRLEIPGQNADELGHAPRNGKRLDRLARLIQVGIVG